ncbi:MAG: hypothetical protein ABFC31_09985 [Clostridiaceae bacterium]
MKLTCSINERVVRICCGIVFALFTAVFMFLSVCSLLGTCVIDPKDYLKEHILFLQDNVWLNLAVLIALFAISALVLFRFGGRIRDKHLRAAKVVLACWTFVLALSWSLSVKTVPTADSKYILEAASQAANGDFSFFSGKLRYFQMFPFQLGMVGVYEIFYRVFGSSAETAMYAFNAFSLAAAYLAIAQITQAVFGDRRVTMLTIVFLGLCFQPMLFSSFLYGNLPGLAAMAWAFALLIRFLQTGYKRSILPIALFCALAITAKQNNWIGVIAICIVLLLSLIKQFKFAKLLCALAVIAAALLLTGGIRYSYEQRANVDLGDGTPQTAWLVMGLSDSTRAPGWYSGYTYTVLKKANWDTARAREQIGQDLASRINALGSDKAYAADFFYQKALSQWNEPSFESVWSSKARKHETALSTIAVSVYEGASGKVLDFGFEHGVQLVYTLSALAFPLALVRRYNRRKLGVACAASGSPVDPACATLLPVFILGGFLYHLLFEAKSYYALTFFVLLLPYAAYGLVSASDWLGLCIFSKKQAENTNKPLPDSGMEP